MKQATVPLRSAIAALGELPTAVESPEDRAARRARVVGRLQVLNRELPGELERARSRRLLRTILAGAALAACTGLALGLGSAAWRSGAGTEQRPVAAAGTLQIAVLRGSAWHSAGDAVKTLSSGHAVGAPEPGVLETLPGGWAKIVGSGGLEVEVSPETRLSLPGTLAVGHVRQLDLARGSVRCSVDPAGAGEKLWVVTPDARVVVKGTIFTVTVAESSAASAGGSRTCVRVERGKVAVSHQGSTTEVVGGGSWGCDQPPTTPDPGPSAAPSAAVSAASIAPTANTAARPERATTGAPGTLAQETALLAEALAAERRGDLSAAEARLVQLRTQYPKSPLVLDATHALVRIRDRRKR